MSIRAQATPDQGVLKVRQLLLGARAQLAADGSELALAFQQPPPGPGEPFPDPIPAITRMRVHLQALREDVLRETGGGAQAATTRALTARALQETEQALAKLVESRLATDDASGAARLQESLLLRAEAKKTSALAGKALGIPWPL